MDRFPTDMVYRPSYTSSVNPDERVLAVQFGDGYQQVAGDGINTSVDTYKCVWTNIHEKHAATVYSFLRKRLKKVPFLFKIDSQVAGEEKQVMCISLSATYNNSLITSITAELRQQFFLGDF